MSTIVSIIVVLVVLGLAMWLINNYIPMQDGIKKVLNIAVIIFAVVWVLKIAGLLSYLKF